MTATLAKAEELIALTEQLALHIERDVTILNGARPAALNTNDSDRAALTLLYGKAMAEFKASALAEVPLTVKARLKAATERLHAGLKEQSRLIARFRHVTEGLVKAIAESVAARQATGVYAKSGSVVKPAAARASALTLNQAV
jgi:hypothetical protein